MSITSVTCPKCFQSYEYGSLHVCPQSWDAGVPGAITVWPDVSGITAERDELRGKVAALEAMVDKLLVALGAQRAT